MLAGSLVAACDDGAEPRADPDPVDAVASPDAERDAAVPDAAVPPGCRSGVGYVYHPLDESTLDTFPDDFHTVDDEASATGLTVEVTMETRWLESIPSNFRLIYRMMNGLDGWGTTAGVVLRFDTPLDTEPERVAESIRFVDLDTEPEPTSVAFEVEWTDDDQTMILWPQRPLRPGTRHGLVVTQQLEAADGACLDPGDAMRTLTGLDPDSVMAADPRLQRLAPRYDHLLDSLALEPVEIAAALVFTTQTITGTSVAVAEDIRGREYRWSQPPACRRSGQSLVCEGRFEAWEWRRSKFIDDAEPERAYEMPVSIWLPTQGEGPWPVLVIGHGLGGDRSIGQALAVLSGRADYAIVAIDSVAHGDHPGGHVPGQLGLVSDFLGISIGARTIDPRVLRDAVRQSTYDKLQLVELIIADRDVDGDGVDDFDPAHIGYVGLSLGGILGSEFLALSDDVTAAVVSVAGARFTTIVKDSDQLSPLIDQILPSTLGEGEIARVFPAIQTVFDRGEPANYAPYVLGDRLSGDVASPSVLMTVAIDDAIVPNSSSAVLAAALGVPHLPPVEEIFPSVELGDAPPVSGNVARGGATAGLYQYRRVTPLNARFGEMQDAAHNTLPVGREHLDQVARFLSTWLGDGPPEIIDPFE